MRRDANPGDLVERDEGAPPHDRVPHCVDATPPGTPRELRVLARREELVALTGELREALDHDSAAGHVDAERERLGGEDDFEEPGRERLLHRLLHRRHQAGVVRREPSSTPARQRP